MQRFYRTADGRWLEASARIAGEWPNDGSSKAEALAAALGVRQVIVVDVPDGEPDPRRGDLLALPVEEAPARPPDPLNVLSTTVDGLRARVVSLEDKIAALEGARVPVVEEPVDPVRVR